MASEPPDDGIAAQIRRDNDYIDRDFTLEVFKAMMLAPTLEICEALLKGQDVPISALDQDWARKFGLIP